MLSAFIMILLVKLISFLYAMNHENEILCFSFMKLLYELFYSEQVEHVDAKYILIIFKTQDAKNNKT